MNRFSAVANTVELQNSCAPHSRNPCTYLGPTYLSASVSYEKRITIQNYMANRKSLSQIPWMATALCPVIN